MNSESEDLIERLLRDQFDGPVPDGGFCDQVMQRVPPTRPRSQWPLAIGAIVGAVLCGISLSSAPIMQIGWQDWRSGDVSPSAIAVFVIMASMAALALAWALGETCDRIDLPGAQSE